MSVRDDTEAIKSLTESYGALMASDKQLTTYNIDAILNAIKALATRIETEAKGQA